MRDLELGSSAQHASSKDFILQLSSNMMNGDEIDSGQDSSGHRERLRKRLIDGGPEALLDHEIIEFLLTLTIPRIDTKPIARRLLTEFGGVEALLCADPESLLHAGLSERSVCAIKIAEASALRLLKTRVMNRPILDGWQALTDYLQADMAHRAVERVRVLHLNGKNRLIRDELVSEGTIDEAAVHVRQVIRRALELGSAALILVHNHPSGDPSPSRQDIELTRQLAQAAKILGIALHDHIVVGSDGQSSMRAMGLL